MSSFRPQPVLDEIIQLLPGPPWVQNLVGLLGGMASLGVTALGALWVMAQKLMASLYEEKFAARLKDHQGELNKKLEDHKNKLSKELAEHKATLEVQHARELESIRADVRVDAFSKQDRLRLLHEKQTQVLADTYADLHRCERAMYDVVKRYSLVGEPPREEYFRKFREAYNRYGERYGANRIYLDKDLCEKLHNMTMEMRDAYFAVTGAHEDGERGPWREAEKWWRSEGQELLAAVEASFRMHVGTLDPQAQPTEEAP